MMTPSRIPLPFLRRIDGVGQWIAPLGLRALLSWEFLEAGLEKLHGDNWFADLGDKFPLPFSLLGADFNWTLAAWMELVASVAILLGVGTRFFAAALWVLTIVAIYAVHWPSGWSSFGELWQGYAITNQGFGNFKLPLIYLAMLLPLMFGGAGRLSFDHLVARMLPGSESAASSDRNAWGVALLAIGLTASILLPVVGGVVAIAGVGLIGWPRRATGKSIRRTRRLLASS
jgi:putative oxidoreductase